MKIHLLFILGPAETKVTYLPDGTVVVVFPTNMSISVESGEHPILENQHRMHFKRKVIMPGKLIHKLEWRFYKRSSKGRSRLRKTVERIGSRMRVGASFSRHASLHDAHGDADFKGKSLLVCLKFYMSIPPAVLTFIHSASMATIFCRIPSKLLLSIYRYSTLYIRCCFVCM
jgi:hypothetical protein